MEFTFTDEEITDTEDVEYIVFDTPEMLTVKEYSEQYGMKIKTVYKRIEYNKNKALAGHIIKEKGKPMLLDEKAQELLKPMSARVKEVAEYCEDTIRKNEDLEKEVSDLAKENSNLKKEIDCLNAELSEIKNKFSESTAELESCKYSLSESNSQLEKCRADVNERDGIISDLRAELESERAIFNTVLNDRSNIISDRDSTIKALEEAQAAAAKKGRGFLGLKA